MQTNSPIIAPAILTSTFEEFENHVERIESHFSYAQIDVMDGVFVPNKSFELVERINNIDTPLSFELHFMVQNPLAAMRDWERVEGVFRVVFHVESSEQLIDALLLAEETGLQIGLALNPETPLDALEPYLDRINLVQFMTVHPGQQGAPFVPSVLEKIAAFKKMNTGLLISVDGGINKTNIKQLHELGVDVFNIGSALTLAPDIQAAHNELLQALKN